MECPIDGTTLETHPIHSINVEECPKCQGLWFEHGQVMATISYGDTVVTVEYCTDEHGVWLDKGELQAIIEALQTDVISNSATDYIKDSLQEAKDIVAGNEGFISEWRDFLTVSRFLQYRMLAENPRLADLLVALQKTTPFK